LNNTLDEKMESQQKLLQERIDKSMEFAESHQNAIQAQINRFTETAEMQQKSIQVQINKSNETASLLSTQVNSMQQSLETLTSTLNAFILQMSGAPPAQQPQQPIQHQPSSPSQQTPLPPPPPPTYTAGAPYVTPQGHFAMGNFSSSLQQAQMQHMNPGYNTKFMSPMYGPPDMTNPSQHQQHSSQQLAGTHTNNSMDMSPKRVGN
jgi:hypothetical protein